MVGLSPCLPTGRERERGWLAHTAAEWQTVSPGEMIGSDGSSEKEESKFNWPWRSLFIVGRNKSPGSKPPPLETSSADPSVAAPGTLSPPVSPSLSVSAGWPNHNHSPPPSPKTTQPGVAGTKPSSPREASPTGAPNRSPRWIGREGAVKPPARCGMLGIKYDVFKRAQSFPFVRYWWRRALRFDERFELRDLRARTISQREATLEEEHRAMREFLKGTEDEYEMKEIPDSWRIKCLRERRREAEEAAAKQRRRSSEGSSTTPRWQRLHEEHKEISSRKAALEEEGRRAADEEAKALLHQVML
ncbi:hypothetical protein AK812_SmicGene33377 [Symbiodinium microadriaticum]|uniref:Uncharacterized protein n=1 Tax=Symbiodinium microadriaticum TaxID=2951 RepID=A0A1Q9CRR6_SYMMI|nr:hypothetical protein AK812_SmicGene33377 [Symbiodinium microadriaticum]